MEMWGVREDETKQMDTKYKDNLIKVTVFLSIFLGKLESGGKIINISDLAAFQLIYTLSNYLKIIKITCPFLDKHIDKMAGA